MEVTQSRVSVVVSVDGDRQQIPAGLFSEALQPHMPWPVGELEQTGDYILQGSRTLRPSLYLLLSPFKAAG